MIEIKKYTGDYADLAGLFQAVKDKGCGIVPEKLATYDLYVGYVDGSPQGFFVILPDDPALVLSMSQGEMYVAFLMNLAGADLLREMLGAIKKTVLAAGRSYFTAINVSDTPDDAWARAYASAGSPTRVGSVFRFDVTQ